MLRKIVPALTVLISVLLDTAVIPVLYYGIYLIPLSLIVVFLIGIILGRSNGMLYGMIAGLLLDISAGSLGLKVFAYIVIGFLIGFLLDEKPTRYTGRKVGQSELLRAVIERAIWIFVLYAVYEVILLVYQYFSTAIFEWHYFTNLLIRTFALTALTSLSYPLFVKMYIGKSTRSRRKKNTREVKTF